VVATAAVTRRRQVHWCQHRTKVTCRHYYCRFYVMFCCFCCIYVSIIWISFVFVSLGLQYSV